MAPDRHSMTEQHRSTNDSTGANITSGYVPTANGSGGVTWSAVTPSGAAGGDLSGTYPNPSVVDDSHAHTSATVSTGGPLLVSDSHSTPIVFADLLLTEEEDDLLYADSW